MLIPLRLKLVILAGLSKPDAGLVEVIDKGLTSCNPAANLARSICEETDGDKMSEAGGGVMLLEYPQVSDGICRARLTTC